MLLPRGKETEKAIGNYRLLKKRYGTMQDPTCKGIDAIWRILMKKGGHYARKKGKRGKS
jgi:hypothetical protein